VLLRREWLAALAVLLGGILLHSMNVLMLATVLPTIVGELGGASLMSLPSTAFLASSIVAATCAGLITATFGARNTYCAGAAVFSAGAVLISLAPAMGWIIAGRFVQGFGGGLIAGVAYVLVRSTFPEAAWTRAISLLSGMWSVSILVGPLVGGVFARYGHWRGAFVAVAAIAVVLTLGAFRWLPSKRPTTKTKPRFPGVRLAFICAAIASASAAAVASLPLAKAALIALAVALLAAMLRLDRKAPAPLLPGDAFSLSTPTGVGMWLILLTAVAYSPLQIFIPIFLQSLHGLDPLSAGYGVACASLGWTAASLLAAGALDEWRARFILIGPLTMAVSLVAAGLFADSAVLAVPGDLRDRRRHRHLLGVRRATDHERRPQRRGGGGRVVGPHDATNGLRPRRRTVGPRRQHRRLRRWLAARGDGACGVCRAGLFRVSAAIGCVVALRLNALSAQTPSS
jgi:MFS family permease